MAHFFVVLQKIQFTVLQRTPLIIFFVSTETVQVVALFQKSRQPLAK